MANAYICDCCANFYTHTDFKQSIPVVDLDGDEIFISMTFAKDGKVVHLCPKCRAAWQKAWDRRAEHKTTDPEHVDKKCTLYKVDEEENNNVSTINDMTSDDIVKWCKAHPYPESEA